jgi:AcrR family transcriptional regulator
VTRTRLSPADRREQLLEIGARLFAERPYDEVSIEEIATLAGVSRGLMYRYFATKRDLFRAIVEIGSQRIVEATDLGPEVPALERLNAGLDAYLEHFEANANLVRAANVGAASADEQVQEIIARAVRRQEERIVSALEDLGVTATTRLRLAVRGWIYLTRMLALDWLDTREISRDELRELCAANLLALAGVAIGDGSVAAALGDLAASGAAWGTPRR